MELTNEEKIAELNKFRDMMKMRRPDLTIQRVPQDTKDKFMKLSEQFCSDYGMTLKWLIDIYMPDELERDIMIKKLIEAVDGLQRQILEIKTPVKAATKTIKTVDGKIHER